MAHPEVVDDNDRETISQMMQHTQSPQSSAVQRLDEIHLTEKQQTSPLVSTSSPQQQQAVFSQSQSGETMVPSTYQPLDSINFSQGVIKEHSQMGKFCDSLLEDNDQVIIKDLQQQTQEQHKVLIEKTADLEKDSNAMKNQLLEMEKERDSLEEKLQKMDTLSNVLKKDRDEMENQLLEMGKERDSLKETLQNTDAMSNNNKKALTMQIESLTTEKGQLQKSEEAIHNITQTYTDQKIEQVVHEVTQLYAPAEKKSEGDNKDDNAKQRPRKQKQDENYYYCSITKDGRKKEPIVLDKTDEPQAEIKKLDNKIAPLEKKARIVLDLLPDQCQETIRKFWELEEGCTHVWDCEDPNLRIYQEDVSSKILKTRTILFPIYGSNQYTLLELDTIDQEWRFYNSIRRQGRRDKYCEATATLRNNVTNYINQHSNKKIKTSAKLLNNTPQQEPGSVDSAVVVAYIIHQKLMKQPIQSDLTKQQCLQMRADIVEAFVSDPNRSWTPEIYHNRMENLRLQKFYDDQELLQEKKKQA
ncbi:hypothetical protein RHGRI_016877 [Rhododendron griersonianum]|uniref:Uncharacterized protein n=1 Tax=Rhododendron griersonianum TaxID=479676 RepID=A0AAV6JVT1_9ERIC|nr:hypothetical protein RHGRI_016877 [Rhododendron griersonianum]